MKSDNTFKAEYNFLHEFIPEALEESTQSLADFITHHFQIAPQTTDYIENQIIDPKKGVNVEMNIANLELFTLPDDLEKQLFDTTSLYRLKLSDDPIQQLINPLSDDMNDPKVIADLIANFGTECFGCYLPMHRFYNSKTTPWGIYLFPSIISANVKFLHKEFPHLPIEDLQRYYTWCIIRHELFHYQTERFATAMEILFRDPYYLEYSEKIYDKYAYTKHWLEEALAENSVLQSKLVSNKSSIPTKVRQELYKYDLSRMPAGYRDYACKYYDGPEKAHCVLAAQILHLDDIDPRPTKIYTIKNQFITQKESVPFYSVQGLRILRVW